MLHIFLVRHLTAPNPGVYLGSRSDPDLAGDDTWKIDKIAGYLGNRPTVVYVSPLKRTLETANLISKKLGLKIIQAESLKEIDFGEWDGKLEKEMAKRHPEKWRLRESDKWRFVHPGGESYEQVGERAIDFIKSLDNDCACVTHQGVIYAVLSKILKEGDNFSSFKRSLQISCGGVTHLLNRDGRLKIMGIVNWD